MKKLILWAAIFLGMFGILITSTTTTNAATWHNGVPTFLKSGLWKATYPKNYYIKFSNQAIHYSINTGTKKFVLVTYHPRYQQTGNTYIIDSDLSGKSGIRTKAIKISQNKIRYNIPAEKPNNVRPTYLIRTVKPS